jgi:hypothetical protein
MTVRKTLKCWKPINQENKSCQKAVVETSMLLKVPLPKSTVARNWWSKNAKNSKTVSQKATLAKNEWPQNSKLLKTAAQNRYGWKKPSHQKCDTVKLCDQKSSKNFEKCIQETHTAPKDTLEVKNHSDKFSKISTSLKGPHNMLNVLQVDQLGTPTQKKCKTKDRISIRSSFRYTTFIVSLLKHQTQWRTPVSNHQIICYASKPILAALWCQV